MDCLQVGCLQVLSFDACAPVMAGFGDVFLGPVMGAFAGSSGGHTQFGFLGCIGGETSPKHQEPTQKLLDFIPPQNEKLLSLFLGYRVKFVSIIVISKVQTKNGVCNS